MAALVLAGAAHAKVFFSKDEALKLAFPDADRVESRSVVLDEAEVARIETSAGAKLESRIVTLYTGHQADRVTGHAVIDTQIVRTHPAAILVVLSPEGVVRSLRVLAFYEPTDYLPTQRWLAQFEGKSAGAQRELRREIHGVAGATLSAAAVRAAVGRALAYYEILMAPNAVVKK